MGILLLHHLPLSGHSRPMLTSDCQQTLSGTSGATTSSAVTVTINPPLVEIMFVDGLRPAFARATLPQDYLEKREDPNAP